MNLRSHNTPSDYIDRYDNHVERLQRELDMRAGLSTHGPGHGGPSQPQPPTIGHGPRDLFGHIMAGGGGGQGSSTLAPPPQDPAQPQGLPPHLTQAAALNTGPPPSQHPSFGGYQHAGPGINGTT